MNDFIVSQSMNTVVETNPGSALGDVVGIIGIILGIILVFALFDKNGWS